MIKDIVLFGSNIFSFYSTVWDWLFRTYSVSLNISTSSNPSGGAYDIPLVGDFLSWANEIMHTIKQLRFISTGDPVSDAITLFSFRPIDFLISGIIAILVTRMLRSVK